MLGFYAMGQIKYETVSNIKSNIGKNIVNARKARGISQSMLVAKLNVYGCTVNRFSVSSIENGHSCDLNLLSDIKDVLDCSWDELLK